MQTQNSSSHINAGKELADAVMQVGPSKGCFIIESQVIDESANVVERQCHGNPSNPGIIFFYQHPGHQTLNPSQKARLRIWGKVFKRVPILLDYARQIVNSLVAYKRPIPPRSNLFDLQAINPLPALATEDPSAQKTAIIALHWLDVGGAEVFAIDCIKLAYEKGFCVIVICDCTGPLTWLHKIEKYVRSIYMLGNLDEKARRLTCFKIISEQNPKLIHIHHCRTVYELLPYLREYGLTSLVMDSTHIVENRHGGFISISHRYSKWIDFHHVISRSLEKFYLAAGINAEKLKTGYLLNKVSLPPENNPSTPLTHPLRIGFIGRLVQQKRPYLFVDLARRLNQKKPGAFIFEMIGEGVLEDQIREQICTAKASINIYHSQHDVKKFLSETDVLVICSDQEGLTLVAFEAIQNNCIILSADVGAQRELVPSHNLLPIQPYQLLRKATNLLLDIEDGKVDCSEIKMMQMKNYEALLSQPSAIETCSRIYDRLTVV